MGAIVPLADNFEKAPQAVALKAPTLFISEVPAGQPSDLVLKPEQAFLLLSQLDSLARHLDGLQAGRGPMTDPFLLPGKDVIKKAGSVLDSVLDAPRKYVLEPIRQTIGTVGLAALALAALYVVTRK
jgi:hypothetical protein